jgi:hypothetical protein
MAAKLIMSWDIAAKHEQEYMEFIINEFLPGLQKIGFTMGEAWVTVYGDYPQILVYVLLPTRREIEQAMQGEDWKTLHGKLMEYVENFSQKVVAASGGFQF